MRATAHSLALALTACVAVAALACVPEERREAADAPGLRGVAEPDLEHLEAAARDQLTQLRLAVEALDAAPAASPAAIGEAYGELGRHYHAYELLAAARDAYTTASELAPDDPRWPRLLELVARPPDDAGGGPADDPLLVELAELRSSAARHLTVGELAFRRGDFAAATVAFRHAVASQPENADAWSNLGSALFRSGDTEAAVAAYGEALEVEPRHTGARFSLGTVLARRGDDAGAIAQYRAALVEDPGHREARFNLANALRRTEQCTEAVEYYGSLVRDDPGHGAARLGEASCLIETGHHPAARERLKEGLQVLPQSVALAEAGARLLAASSDRAVRDGAQALDLARRLVAIGRTPRHLETLAMALAETGELRGAVEVQEAALAAAEGAGQVEDLGRLRANLERYRQGQPCRDPAIG